MEGVRLTRMLAMTSAERVAQQGYEAAMAGRAIAIPGLMNWLGVQSLRVTPRVVVRRLVGWLNRKARR